MSSSIMRPRRNGAPSSFCVQIVTFDYDPCLTDTEPTCVINPNPTLFGSWYWRKHISEASAGNKVRLVQLSLKVMREAFSPLTGEDRGEGA